MRKEEDLSSGRKGGIFAAHTPSPISTMTKKVGLKACNTKGVEVFAGVVYPKFNRPNG